MKNQSGFTMIELVIVIILLGIVAAAVTPRFQDTQSSARQAVVDAAVGAVKSAAIISFTRNQGVAVTGANLEAQIDLDGAVQFAGGALGACNAAGGADTPFTIQHADDNTVQRAGTIPNQFCNL